MKKKVLVVLRSIDKNGISKFVENVFLLMNKNEEIEVNILSLTKKNDVHMVNKLKDGGIDFFEVPSMKNNFFGHLVTTFKIINQKYDVIHFHIDNWTNFVPIFFAVWNKESQVFIQSHNSRNEKIEKSRIKFTIHKTIKFLSRFWSIKRLAVSDEAANWLFGDNTDVVVLPNPINVNEFIYSDVERNRIRRQYGIKKDDFLFGNIARMEKQKNPLFLLKTFNEIKKIESKSKLILVGTGNLREKIINFINENQLLDSVILIDWTDDTSSIYSALDEIIFPSLFEGMPLSLLEAQCTGLPIVYSDSVTKTIEINNNVLAKPLSAGTLNWAKEALYVIKQKNQINRHTAYKKMIENGYDYKQYLINLEKMYFE